jgi:ferric-dicitrate binding protein FerR (iron transport regulator)
MLVNFKEFNTNVKAADFEVEATGTQFNVCTYNSDKFSTTTLAEGAVSLRIKNSNQIFTIFRVKNSG